MSRQLAALFLTVALLYAPFASYQTAGAAWLPQPATPSAEPAPAATTPTPTSLPTPALAAYGPWLPPDVDLAEALPEFPAPDPFAGAEPASTADAAADPPPTYVQPLPAALALLASMPVVRATWDDIAGAASTLLGTPYLWGGNSAAGLDCSAFVSALWGVPRQTTQTLPLLSRIIGKDDLQPGDILNLTAQQDPRGYGHVRLFAGWADAAQTRMWVYGQTPPVATYHAMLYDPRYTPLRRADFTEAGATRLASYQAGPDDGAFTLLADANTTPPPSATPTESPTATVTATPSVSPTAGVSPSGTPAGSATPAGSVTPTATATPGTPSTPTPTPGVVTVPATATPSPTATPRSACPGSTPVATTTASPTRTPTPAATVTPVAGCPSPTATATPPAPTRTPLPPVAPGCEWLLLTATPTPSATRSAGYYTAPHDPEPQLACTGNDGG